MDKKKLIRRILYVAASILALYFIISIIAPELTNLSPDSIKTLTDNNLFLIIIVMFAVMFIQNLLNFIPIILVMSANFALFGFWKGYAFSLICSVIASTIIFLIFRYLFKDYKASSRFDTYKEKIEKKGFFYVLFARLIPIMPTNLINIAAGVSTIKLSHYIVATLIGNALYGFIISFITSTIFV